VKGRLQAEVDGVAVQDGAGAHEVGERAPADFHDLLHGSTADVSGHAVHASSAAMHMHKQHAYRNERKNSIWCERTGCAPASCAPWARGA